MRTDISVCVSCVVVAMAASTAGFVSGSELLLFCSGVLIIVLAVIASETRIYNQGPLSPGILVFISYLFYTAVPLVAVHKLSLGYSEATFEKTAILHLIAAAGLYAGFRVGRNLPLRRFSFSPSLLRARISRPIAAIIGITLAVCGFGLLAAELSAAGGLDRLMNVSYGQRRAILKDPVVPLDISVHVLNVALIVVAWVATTGSNRLWWLFLAVSLAVYGWVMFGLGRRLPLGVAVLAILIVYDRRRSRIHWGKACIIGLAVLVVFGVWGRVRNLPNNSDVGEYVSRNISLAWFSPAYAEVDGSVVVTLEAVQEYTERSDFLLGRSYFYDLSLFIPRALYPGERPQPFRERFHAKYFPEMHARGAGYGSSPIAESYVNLGIAGPAVIFGLIGVVVGRLTQLLERAGWHDGLLLVCAGAVPWAVLIMRSTTVTAPKLYILLYLIPLVALSIVAAPRRKFMAGAEQIGAKN